MKIMASNPITSWQIDGETMETVTNFIFLGSKSRQTVAAVSSRLMLLRRKAMRNRQQKRDITLPTKVYIVKVMVCPLVIYGSEFWTIKKPEQQRIGCVQTVVMEKTLESPLDCKGMKPVHPKGNQPWMFIGRTDAEPEAPIIWPPDAKSWLIWKDPDAGKNWRQEERGWQRMRRLDGIRSSMDMILSKL